MNCPSALKYASAFSPPSVSCVSPPKCASPLSALMARRRAEAVDGAEPVEVELEQAASSAADRAAARVSGAGIFDMG